MSQSIPPPPPSSLPETPRLRRDSRYQRPKKYVSWWGLAFGLALGIIGGLVYAWLISPVEEFDTEAYQLRAEDKAQYVVAIMLQYNHDSDLGSAVNRLIELRVGDDPIQSVADIACDLARRGYVETTSGLNAVRIMKTFYQLQGRSGCADTLIPDVEDVPVVTLEVPTSTPTLVPPPTKTPTPQSNFATPTPSFVVVPTNPPQRDYDGRIVGTTCSLQTEGLIEVFVQSFDGEGIPGEPIRVRWDGGEDQFISGLKPERGDGYADFQMEAGRGYTIEMPGLSDPVSSPIIADSCFTNEGEEAITTYQVVFRQVG